MASNYQNITNTTIARDFNALEKGTDNIYESIAIISKRANQISAQLKEELHAKLDEFNNDSDTLEEVFENREQIEISMAYERLPKPTLIATEEFLAGKIYHRNPEREKRLAEGN
jgi:DNA-directed RNA polymerase subunit K/omega